jgi:hypothetical protein
VNLFREDSTMLTVICETPLTNYRPELLPWTVLFSDIAFSRLCNIFRIQISTLEINRKNDNKNDEDNDNKENDKE